MPWQKSYEEPEVLERAMIAFWARGYDSTSMADLVAATGINRGSIYAAFKDKRGLFLEALKRYDQLNRRDFLQSMADTHEPREAILETFEIAAKNTGEGKTPAGCMLVNLAIELSPHDREVRQFIENSLQAVEDFFFTMIEEAKRQRTIPQSKKSRECAQALLGLLLGLRVVTRSIPRPDTIRAITSQARALLE